MGAISPFASHVVKMRAVAARRDLRRSQQTRARFWHVVVVSSFFFIVVGTGLFLGAVMVIGVLRSNSGKAELTAEGRTGRIARSLQDGKLCHYILFDNKTAQTVEDRIARCDEGKPKPERDPSGPSAGAASGLRVTDSIDNCAAPTDSRPTTCLQSQCRETACENSQRKACRWQACRECACAL